MPASAAPAVHPTDEFQYLAVLISIVLGLGLTQLLTNLGRLAQSRARVRHYWPATVWTVLLFFILVQSWWAMYDMRGHQGWTFLKFVLILATPTALYLMAALALPEVDARSTEPVDLRAHYFAQTRWFFGASVALIVSSLLRPLAMDGWIPLDLDRVIQLVFLAAAASAMFIRREWLHKVLAVGTAGLYAAYVTLLFARLR